MYQNYVFPKTNYQTTDRFVPFAGPFLLGALTGGVAVGALTGPRPNYNYNYPGMYYRPYYYY